MVTNRNLQWHSHEVALQSLFPDREKIGEPGEKPRSEQATRTSNKLNLQYIWHWAEIEPGIHWWEASALTTAPSLQNDMRTK